MLHEPATTSQIDYASGYKSKLGVYLFILYALIYAGFVVINVTNPLLMERIIFSGLNLAVIYGFGLIIFAIVLALVYNHLCTKKEKEMNTDTAVKGAE